MARGRPARSADSSRLQRMVHGAVGWDGGGVGWTAGCRAWLPDELLTGSCRSIFMESICIAPSSISRSATALPSRLRRGRRGTEFSYGTLCVHSQPCDPGGRGAACSCGARPSATPRTRGGRSASPRRSRGIPRYRTDARAAWCWQASPPVRHRTTCRCGGRMWGGRPNVGRV